MLIAEREIVKTMNNRLKEMRKKTRTHVDTLAEHLEISSTYYYDLEKGNRRLNEEILIKLANFYNTTTDYLLGRDEKFICQEPIIDEESKELINDFSVLSPETKEIIKNLIKLHKNKL